MDDTSIQSVTETKEPTDESTLIQLETEIKSYISQISQNIIEIGKRLIQAKSLVQHGQWQDWLKNNFQLSKSTAYNFMQCAERYKTFQSIGNLNSTQMIALLSLPESDTEEFIKQKANAGTPVSDMSIKTLRKEIKQWNVQKDEFTPSESDENDKNIIAETSFSSIVNDNPEQSECNESDIVIINNSEPKEQSSVYTQQPSSQSPSPINETSHNNDDKLTISKTSTEVKENYLIDDISTMCASLIQSENRNEIIQNFAKNNPNQLDIVIKNLTTIISELQSIRKNK